MIRRVNNNNNKEESSVNATSRGDSVSKEIESDNSEGETEFLYVLASLLKESEPTTMSEKNQQNETLAETDERIENANFDAIKSTPEDSVMLSEDIKESNTSADPEVMAVASVMEMFEQIRRDFKTEITRTREEDLKQFTTELKQLKDSCTEQAVQEVSKQIDKMPKIAKMQSEVSFWKFKSEALTDVCQRMQIEINDLTQRVENLELNNAKRMIMIHGSGIRVDGKKYEATQEIQAMIELAMTLRVSVHDCFNVGTALVAILATPEEKRSVLKNKSRLKDFVSETGGKIFINDYLPPFSQEKR